MSCCTYGCTQSADCPARACPLHTDNSDGSSAGHAEDELLDDTGLLILQGMALVGSVVSAVIYASLWF